MTSRRSSCRSSSRSCRTPSGSSLIVSVPTALLSCFLVLKGWALMGDAVSHAVLPGIVLAYIVGLAADRRRLCRRHDLRAR